MKITVNGREHEIVPASERSSRSRTVVMRQFLYESICELAGVPVESRPTITYKQRQSEGEVCPGGSVSIYNGAVINCTITNRA